MQAAERNQSKLQPNWFIHTNNDWRDAKVSCPILGKSVRQMV